MAAGASRCPPGRGGTVGALLAGGPLAAAAWNLVPLLLLGSYLHSGDPRGPRPLYRRGVPLVADPGRVPVNAALPRGDSRLGATPFVPPPWVKPAAGPRRRIRRLDAVLPHLQNKCPYPTSYGMMLFRSWRESGVV